jgi:sulfate adenylyltransferase subunit 1 (EFTu-like GTPase family)
MAQTKVKQDAYGLYVRTNGSIYRPQLAQYDYMMKVAAGDFAAGEAVKVGHISQTPHARVKSLDGSKAEVWSAHGTYLKIVKTNGAERGEIPSHEVWNPRSK